jgi:hypothetical protein
MDGAARAEGRKSCMGTGGGGGISCSVAQNIFHSKTKAYEDIKTFLGVPVSLGRVPGVADANFAVECELLLNRAEAPSLTTESIA